MRLIDADALLEELNDKNVTELSALIQEQRTIAFYVYFKVVHAIEEMPTIEAEPVQHGHLVESLEERIKTLEKRNEPMNPSIRIDKNGIHLACAKCGEILETLIDGEAISMNPWKWNYCRVCGQAVKWDD